MKGEQRESADFAFHYENDDNNSLESDLGLASCVRQIFVFLSWLLLLATFPFSLFFSIRIIPEYKRAVIFRLGRLHGREKGPGLFFVTPCVDQTKTVDLRIRTFEIPPLECMTKDAVAVLVEGVVYYHVFNAILCVTAIEDADHSTRHISSSILRNLVGGMMARDVLSQRDRLKQNVAVQLDEVTVLWGVKLDRVEIKDIRIANHSRRSFSPSARAESDYEADHEDGQSDQGVPPRRPSVNDMKEEQLLAGQSLEIVDERPLSPPKTLTAQLGRSGVTSMVSPPNCYPHQSSGEGSGSQRPSTGSGRGVVKSGSGRAKAASRQAPNPGSGSVSNQETPNSMSTQITPLNNHGSMGGPGPASNGAQVSMGAPMAPMAPINTLQYLNWLNNQSNSNGSQPSSLMWPPLEMCFVPVTINTEGQLQSQHNNSNVRNYDEPSHSPTYANAAEAAAQPLLCRASSPDAFLPGSVRNSHSRSRSPSPPPPPPPPPPLMTQSQFSVLTNDDPDTRPVPLPALYVRHESPDTSKFPSRLAHLNLGQCSSKKRSQSSLSISSSSTMSDSAAVLDKHSRDDERSNTLDRSNTKSVPLGTKETGSGKTRSAASRKNMGTAGSTNTVRSSTSRSQQNLPSPQPQSQPQQQTQTQPQPQHSHLVTHAQVHAQPQAPPTPPTKPKSQSSTGGANAGGGGSGKSTGRRRKAESPPPMLPPKPKGLENGNGNGSVNVSVNNHDLLLCKATDITSNALTAGRRSVPVSGSGPPKTALIHTHNNGVYAPGRAQQTTPVNGQQQVPQQTNIGFVPVSLLASANRSMAISNNLPYAVSSLPVSTDANNNANDGNFLANSAMNNIMYSTVVNHPLSGIVTSAVIGSPQLQPVVKRTLESISSSSTASKKSSLSGYAPGQQKANSGADSCLKVVLSGNAPVKSQSSFVSFATNSSIKSNSTMSNV